MDIVGENDKYSSYATFLVSDTSFKEGKDYDLDYPSKLMEVEEDQKGIDDTFTHFGTIQNTLELKENEESSSNMNFLVYGSSAESEEQLDIDTINNNSVADLKRFNPSELSKILLEHPESDDSFSNANFLIYDESSNFEDTRDNKKKPKNNEQSAAEKFNSLKQFENFLDGTESEDFSLHNNFQVNGDSSKINNYKSNHIKNFNTEDVSPDGHPNWEDIMSVLMLSSSSFTNSMNISNVIKASDISNECKNSLILYVESLSRWEKWAVMMADASGKVPGGILEGTTLDFGSYEECLKVRSYSNDETENFRGQYCMIGYQSPLLTNLHQNPQDFKKYAEIYGKPPEWIEDFIKRSGKYLELISFFLGTCVPSTCSTEDVRTIASQIVSPLGLNVSVPSCEVDEPKIWTSNGLIALGFFVILAHLCIIGTIVDIATRCMPENQQSLKISCLPLYILRTFSLYLNSEKFFARSKDGNSLSFFNGMRFISFTWVVINHTWGIYEKWRMLTYRSFLKMDDEIDGYITVPVIEGAHVAVDTFFMISGFLLVYTTWKRLVLSGGKLNVFRFMIQKFWRLYPSLGVTITLFLVYHYYGSGPIFKVSTQESFSACYTHWMWNFLFINNWWRVNDMCLPHTWFLSALMQSHLVGVILLIVAYRYPFAGVMLGASIAVGTSILLALINIFNNHPMPIFFTLKDMDFKYDFINMVHFKTYTHINTYLIGMVVGFLLLKYNDRKMKNVHKVCGWVLAVLLALYVMEGKYVSTDNRAFIALYNATHRTAWALAIGWVTYICATGHGGIVNRFLSWHGFELLSNISYSAYLLHILVIFYRNTSLTERFPYGEVEIVCEIVLVTVISCIMSVLAYIAVEMPFTAIGGLIFKR
ncbi:hypothetical protein JTE90_004115 [Oedothorax gibbosus]|uniref:Nose resistant-to-fluoxetine protein N-terminal domain-containing protein n=1 Tax=Oedothorax gibbosus TaxID=931172 RepID=A0AAV6V1B9_9ARAC|nr:hypothetical protein JTE90_004115 [Oedothorax gibbosus]